MKQQLDELKSRIANNPKDSRVLRQLGWLYLNNHYLKRAHEEYCLAAGFNPRLISEIILDHEQLLAKEPENSAIRLSLISFLLNFSEIDTAILELEELLEIDPNNAAVYNLLGKIYVSLNQTDKALALLEKALEYGIKEIGISQMLAGVYLKKGRLEEAIQFYEELRRNNPGDKNILRTLGELYTRTNNFDPAAERYGQLFASDPESAQEVIKKLGALLLSDETNVKIREILVEIYMKTLKPDAAAETLREILLLDPAKIDFAIGQTKIILKNYPNHPQALITLASVLAEKNDFSEAIENYNRLIKHHPDFQKHAVAGCLGILKKFPDQYTAHQFLAQVYLSKADYQEAIAEMHKLLALHSDSADWIIQKCKDLAKKNPVLHEILGYAYLSKENSNKAQTEAEALLSHDKKSASAYILLGKINIKKNLTRKACDSFLNALKLSPHDIEIHKICRKVQIKELSLEETSIKKRILEDEWKTELHFDLAKVYINMGRRPEALKELQLASRDQQRAPAVFNTMAELYIEEGRFNLAQSVLRKTDQSSNHSQFKTALCYEAQGNIKKAIKVLEEILSDEIDYPGLDEKIKLLKTSSLKSLQNRMLALTIFTPETKKIYAFWGRESRSSSRKQNITTSFGLSHNNAGFDYYIKGMFKAALEEFDLAAKIDPAFTASTNNLGVTYIAFDRINEAIAKFKEALRIEPASSILLNNLGAAYFMEGNLEQAEKYLLQARENNPELASAAINLGDVSYQRENAELAINSYRSVGGQDILSSLAQKRLLCKTA
ncbi:MAG: tetratricopeptide repeat protein [Candidatus Saganbacteria bacterium]|nr:tetratricopeptide repeat protein [Candidatus Saganbacteria bacterium]